MDETKLEKVELRGAKRLNICPSDWQEGVWIVHGKDDGCQAEGTWEELVSLAEQILTHPNTAVVKFNKDLQRFE
jgi:hypothetical protein